MLHNILVPQLTTMEMGCRPFRNKYRRKKTGLLNLNVTERFLEYHRSNSDILQDLNVDENWLINSTMSQTLIYSGHVKHHSGLERTVMKGMIPGRRGRDQPTQSCARTRTLKTPWV